ncbi:multi-sensor hybrid histidine kinase [Emticicia oligotrophica DSM 17448]|uniref:histidine kinase n=1 Tax=Emticicia oligotrophica (strain DSM 17448 / CIP 109782 / MTCC 6937 / GPTSA100-15) TaxID=929562 RepID=A0ABM5MY21_EMTOG|nr:PAS domain S-box protein [Emticicia oligotrophica]AFK02027.1 multi-sensor hybrid histidine kinase [Emticicia oligotrophica DSM 17448]
MHTDKSQEDLLFEIEKLKFQLSQAQPEQGIDQLKDLVDNTSEIIMLLSLSGRFLFVNTAFRDTFGYSDSELTQLTFKDMLHPQFAENALDTLQRLKEGDEQIIDFQTVVRNKDGKRVYLLGDISCRFENGKPTAFRCLFRDITQRRRAEKAQQLYYTIAQLNLNTLNLHEFLTQVHEELQKNIQANNFFVALYEPEESSIYFPYFIDEYSETEGNYHRRKLGNGIVEYSMVQNKPLFLTNEDIQRLVEVDKIYFYGSALPEVMLCVPLRVGERTTGVIGVKSYSDRNKFNSRDLELLEFVSGQVAVALVRKQKEEDLVRQTARLNAVFDSSSHVIWTVNQKRQLSSFNRNYVNLIQRTLGNPPEINMSIEKLGWKLISPEDRPILREKYNEAFRGQPQYFEMHWGNIDGGDDWYEFFLNPILSTESGQVEEVSGIAQNITDKKNSTITLQKSEQKFRDTIESFIDIYYRTDLGGNITMISPSVLTHTGYTVEEVMGNKVDKFFENAVDSSKNIKGLLKAGSITNFEVVVKRKNGELRQFMLNIRMIKDSKGIPIEVEGVARDISELKKTTAELLVAKDEAERSLKVKERFLANMSHEIRTPMNGVIGMIDLMYETPLNPEQKDYVQTIKKSSETLLTILNDILDLSKIEAGKMDLHNAPLDIKEILERLVALFRQRAIEKNNKISYHIADDVPAYLIADQTRLLQIFSNLTSNALKFTENGSVTISLSKVSANGKINILRGEITDTGIGISEDDQKLLFGAFQQVDNSTKKSFGGTGLGLAISRELCRLMKGDMGVISTPGKGSTFWFTIEVRSTTISPSVSESSEAEIQLTNFFSNHTPKILLVDDNQVNRKVASEILIKAGCEVLTADSGAKAIEVFGEGHGFDVIFMDIQMPEMDGIETTKRLRQLYGNALPKIVAMTAYSMQHDRERFLSEGMDDYVPKPIRASILIQKVNEIVPNAQAKSPQTAPPTITVDDVDKKVDDNSPIDPSIPAFDMEIVNQLKEMVGAEMLASVFEDFENEAEEQIQNTKNAYPDDVRTIQRELHTLKGNSGTIGLARIHEITAIIEVPSKTGDLTNFLENMAVLEKEYQYFKDNYKNLV